MFMEDQQRLREAALLIQEINLPPVQAGSTIMPGKVNPVIPEVVNQIAFQVIGNDVTVSFAAEPVSCSSTPLNRSLPTIFSAA
jgi:aspartate ammonia-lyase